ncbi:hypothetical protein QVN85_01705 [Oscillibacter valericigenes]|nr:hypothetical protein [Oscillibacter valericigenes]
MSWEQEFAGAMKELGKKPSGTALLEGTVVSIAPLTFSLYGGEVMAPPMPLAVTESAAGYTVVSHSIQKLPWHVGDRAACAMMGKTLVVLGRL